MADTETLYNFGVLTKRYELVSRTAGQFAPGILGAAIGFVMLLVGAPAPVTVAPVLVGFWFALGKVPVGRHRGMPVRTMVVPICRFMALRVGGQARWEMPGTWRTVTTNDGSTRHGSTRGGSVNGASVGTASVAPSTDDRFAADDRPSGIELPDSDGKNRGRKHRAPEPREQLPPELGRLRWQSTNLDGAEAGLLAERVGRRHLLTAVVSVTGGDRFVFSGPDEQAAQITQWGEVLKSMAGDGRGLRRLQWVERATPQPSTVQEDWAAKAMRCVASAKERMDYRSLQAAISTAAIHHDVYLGAQVETEATDLSLAVTEATAELSRLCEHLRSIGLHPRALSRRAIASVMREWADPTAADRLALWGEGSIPVSQAGPASRLVGYDTLRTDGYLHRVGQIAAWPRIDVGTEWMYPLLAAATAGSVRTVSMHFEAVSTEAAFAEVRDARTTGGMAQRKRDEKGVITTEEEERRTDEARSRERELTRGFRQHRIAGLVMVSSPTEETVNLAWRQAETKAVECHLDLRELHARGHVAWAATLPLCRLRFARGLV